MQSFFKSAHLPLAPTIAQKIRETTPNNVTGLASGTIAEALRLKNGSEGTTVATALQEPLPDESGDQGQHQGQRFRHDRRGT